MDQKKNIKIAKGEVYIKKANINNVSEVKLSLLIIILITPLILIAVISLVYFVVAPIAIVIFAFFVWFIAAIVRIFVPGALGSPFEAIGAFLGKDGIFSKKILILLANKCKSILNFCYNSVYGRIFLGIFAVLIAVTLSLFFITHKKVKEFDSQYSNVYNKIIEKIDENFATLNVTYESFAKNSNESDADYKNRVEVATKDIINSCLKGIDFAQIFSENNIKIDLTEKNKERAVFSLKNNISSHIITFTRRQSK